MNDDSARLGAPTVQACVLFARHALSRLRLICVRVFVPLSDPKVQFLPLGLAQK